MAAKHWFWGRLAGDEGGGYSGSDHCRCERAKLQCCGHLSKDALNARALTYLDRQRRSSPSPRSHG